MITKNFPWPGDIRDGSIFDGVAWQQIVPRLMVYGDIGDWADVVYWNFVKSARERTPLPPLATFGDWANNARTIELLKRHAKMQEVVLKGGLAAIRASQYAEELQKELAAAKDEIERRCVNIDKLESELRQEKTLTNCYMRAAERRLTRMRELQAAVDDKDNFIQMQAQQLKNARADVARLRQRSDLFSMGSRGVATDSAGRYETPDNGPT